MYNIFTSQSTKDEFLKAEEDYEGIHEAQNALCAN